MNTLRIFLLCSTIVLAGCATSKTSNAGERDGSTVENAVIAKSINSEYEWLRKTYPGSQVQSQALVNKDRKYYDVLTVKMADGSTKKFWFDINSFYGKMF